MKQMIQRMREEKGGFTLAELLVVVAIIAVMVRYCHSGVYFAAGKGAGWYR